MRGGPDRVAIQHGCDRGFKSVATWVCVETGELSAHRRVPAACIYIARNRSANSSDATAGLNR
jgi:hypothetical protein